VAETAYRALALQTRCRSINGATSTPQARESMREAIARIRTQVAASLAFVGRDCKLVVLPEYVLTGHPVGEPVPVWRERAAIDQNGPEEEALAAIAQENSIYLSANAYVTDPKFDGLYFQSSFVIDPSGSVVLRYRRLNSMFAPTPHDVLDRFVDTYGAEALFPVARTEIGALACIASEEILFPELARCFALRGAEVFLHSTSEVGSPLVTQKDVARRARAMENVAYVVSANTAGIEGSPIPGASTDGGSQIVDYEGRVLVEAGPGESMVANAELDLGALRRARARPGMGNLLARNRLDLYAPTYASASVHTANGLGDGEVPERGWFLQAHRDAIARVAKLGGAP
jgi:predicted amidohydrolase